MNYCSIDNLCLDSISSHCNKKCGQNIHIPPHLPIYDGHIHLNEISSEIQPDFFSIKKIPPVREYHFINNNHKPDEWFVPNPFPVYPHVHVYPTIGIHPKYFNTQILYKTLDDMKSHLQISHNTINPKNKIVAVGECGLDDTGTATIDQQMFVLEKQIDLAIQFHLPIVLHCRGAHLYRPLFDCLKNRIYDKNFRMHWHCINNKTNLHLVDLFLNTFPNAYIGLNGSITYGMSTESFIFQNWLINRSPFLPERLILETDYPYLKPRNLEGIYDPSSGLIATALYLQKMINSPNQNLNSYIHSSNENIKFMYRL